MIGKLYAAAFSLLVFSILFTSSVVSDGGIWIKPPDEMSDWELMREDQQLCAIYYENGFQNMILTIGLSQLEGEKAIWIFPVPAKPDETVIDIIKGFPTLSGDDIHKEAEKAVTDTFNLIRMTQPYYAGLFFPFLYGSMGGYWSGMSQRNFLQEDGITVHERIEKMGLTTELITAERADAFHNYLSGKDVNLPDSSKAVFDEYIGQEFSFVVSWISDIDEFKNSTVTYPSDIHRRYISPYYTGISKHILGVAISFPTDKIYYPLKPTSVYGSVRIPTVIYVMSYVTPELYPGIAKDAQVEYYYDSYHAIPEYLSSFYNGKLRINDFQFTKIRLDPPSKLLTEDLWIVNAPPPSVAAAQFLRGYGGIWGIAVLIIASCLSSMLVGWKMFRYHEPQLKNFALLGLANCTSLIGFLLISHRFRIDERFSKFKNPEKKLNYQRVIEISIVLAAIPVIYLFFVLVSRSFSFSFFDIQFLMIIAMVIAPLFLGFFPFVWLFYRDRKLFKFVMLFSVAFLALSYVFEFLIQLLV